MSPAPLQIVDKELVPVHQRQIVQEVPRYKFRRMTFPDGLGPGLAWEDADLHELLTGAALSVGKKIAVSIVSVEPCTEDGQPATCVRAMVQYPDTPAWPVARELRFFFAQKSYICFKVIDRKNEKFLGVHSVEGSSLDDIDSFVPKAFKYYSATATEKPQIHRVYKDIQYTEFRKVTPGPETFRLEQFGLPDLAETPPPSRQSPYLLPAVAGASIALASVLLFRRSRRRTQP